MNQQTDIDFTEKQPTALMRLEAVVRGMSDNTASEYSIGHYNAIQDVLTEIEQLKPSELADLKRSFCDGYTETESAETWSKKWGKPN
jgi:hypothetical protein